jgi:hypothetical protein
MTRLEAAALRLLRDSPTTRARRPPGTTGDDLMPSTHTTLRVPPAVAEGLAILAAAEDRAVSSLVRRLIVGGGPSLVDRLCALAVDESAPLALRERASTAALVLDAEVSRG